MAEHVGAAVAVLGYDDDRNVGGDDAESRQEAARHILEHLKSHVSMSIVYENCNVLY